MHRRAFSVASFLLRPTYFANGMLDLLRMLRRRGTHPYLFAVIQKRCCTSGQKQCGDELGDLVVVNAIAVTVPLPWLIVIAEKIERLAMCWIVVYLIQQPSEFRGGKTVDVGDLKVHWQLDFIVVAVHSGELRDVRLVGFADQDGITWILVDDAPHFPQNFMNLRQVVGVFVLDVWITIGILPRQNRIVVQAGILKETGDRVNPKASHSAIKPEAHHVIHGLSNLRVAPIQVGLFCVEILVAILIRCGITSQAGTPKQGKPVVWWMATVFPIAPDIPVPLRTCS